MDELRQFSIPLAGLKIGIHQFDFKIDDAFFTHFEETPIQHGSFEVNFILDKREDMLVMTFYSKGSFKTECDRCLANINLPVDNNEDLIVKYAQEANDDAEVIYIPRETSELNVAKYVYEFICLGMPVTNIYNCEEEEENVCDLEMLDFLDKKEATEESPESSPWDALKNFKSDN